MAKKESNKKVLEGVVAKLSSKDTVAVRVESKFPHPKYGRIVKTHKKYLVHVEGDLKAEVGDIVLIREIKPVSKMKSWQLDKIIEKNSIK